MVRTITLENPLLKRWETFHIFLHTSPMREENGFLEGSMAQPNARFFLLYDGYGYFVGDAYPEAMAYKQHGLKYLTTNFKLMLADWLLDNFSIGDKGYFTALLADKLYRSPLPKLRAKLTWLEMQAPYKLIRFRSYFSRADDLYQETLHEFERYTGRQYSRHDRLFLSQVQKDFINKIKEE